MTQHVVMAADIFAVTLGVGCWRLVGGSWGMLLTTLHCREGRVYSCALSLSVQTFIAVFSIMIDLGNQGIN